MSSPEVDIEIYHYVSQFAAAYRQRLAKLAEPFQLTGSQLQMLISIKPGESAPMKNLCMYLSCDPSYVTNVIERLVSLQLIERHEASGDRRIKMIALTEKGEHIRSLVIASFSAHTPTAELSSAEKQQLLGLCEKMSGLVEKP